MESNGTTARSTYRDDVVMTETILGNTPQSQAPVICHERNMKRYRKNKKMVAFDDSLTLYAQEDSTVGRPRDAQHSALILNEKWYDYSDTRSPLMCPVKVEYDFDLSSTSLRAQPNILKKREHPLPDPIKSLSFSPSRFLNSSASALPPRKDKVTKNLNFSISGHADDSGLENMSYESDEIFAKALTSTPISKKRKSLLTPLKTANVILSPLKPEFPLSETCVSESNQSKHTMRSRDSGNETVFKTPLIRRYLNESGPRTPTPFKCETISEGHDLENSMKPPLSCDLGSLETDLALPISASYDMEPSLFEHPPRIKSQCNLSGIQKKARKALKLDQELSHSQSYNQVHHKHNKDLPLATQLSGPRGEYLGFIPFSNPIPQSKIHVHSCSGLVDCKTIVQCRNFGLGRKSYCTSHQNTLTICHNNWNGSTELTAKWVKVACGRSDDQKAMTLAARRYLRNNGGPGRDVSSVRLKKRFACGDLR